MSVKQRTQRAHELASGVAGADPALLLLLLLWTLPLICFAISASSSACSWRATSESERAGPVLGDGCFGFDALLRADALDDEDEEEDADESEASKSTAIAALSSRLASNASLICEPSDSARSPSPCSSASGSALPRRLLSLLLLLLLPALGLRALALALELLLELGSISTSSSNKASGCG